MNNDLVIVSSVRTPFGRFGGSLKEWDCIDLSAIVMKEAVKRAGVESGIVDEVLWGVGDTASSKDVYTPVIARQALLKAGLPPETPSCSFDKACVSGISAIQLGMRAIKSGEASVIMAGGVTTFSKMPLLLRDMRWSGSRLGSIEMEDPLFALGYKDYNPVAVDAGEVALENGISREEQDEWAYRSHQRYGQAHQEGKFKDEMLPLTIEKKLGKKVTSFELDIDEQYRSQISIEGLAKLKCIYGSPTVTAGNSPGLNDGAAAMLVTTRQKAKELGLIPIAKIETVVSTAMEARLLAIGPSKAMQMALQKVNLTVDDISLFEINEAFAAVTLTSSKILANNDAAKWDGIKKKLNVNGGAIAIGHANTCSGTRIIMTLIHELQRRGGGYGIASICGGLAQADACIVKVD
ncbi:acetyl-CoA C-acetyltransferase [Desulfotomaculum arcticum]|uniref:acetyl-CoA C-acetyltransferase n=1 Tax=Desulfotruncus arcticus DSM 17038 TaxID=1121424 RepID=A0A1I2TKK0_9FIRM|nr:thiolase family protein [Desulfotruncus arcticus]SFG63907.1 acetyl-CoA C-acetyltransferase [Desulfotomaculum arcticum] [Desulfotruncus arcticus DSM 17038]